LTARPTKSLASDPPESQEAVFRSLANPKTPGLSEAVVRVDAANAVVFLAGADASDADADVASRKTVGPLDEKGWAMLAATGSLSDRKALARGVSAAPDESATAGSA
jgi:uncharacterized membrane protein